MPKYKQKDPKPIEALAAQTTKVRETYERNLAISSLEQIAKEIAKQDNVKVVVPANGLELGYEITCSRDTYMRKYSHFKMVEL